MKAYRRRQTSYDALELKEARRTLKAFERKYGRLEDRVRFRIGHLMPYFVCRNCGKPYVKLVPNGGAPTGCSDDCVKEMRERKNAAEKAMVVAALDGPEWKAGWIEGLLERKAAFRICRECKQPFLRKGSRGPKPNYCNKVCGKRHYERRQRNCPVCGTRFDIMNKQGRMTKKYCSDPCSEKAHKWRQADRAGGKPRDGMWRYGLGHGAPITEMLFEDQRAMDHALQEEEWRMPEYLSRAVERLEG
jgi:hypothetical protein